MIKLIASDLDGTILQHGRQSVTPKMIEIIKELQKKGIIFVAASGRQYPNMYRLFGEVSKDMAFICENGAFIKYKDQVISKTAMDRETGIALMKDIWEGEGCEILLSGENTSYIKAKKDTFLHRMKNLVKNNVTEVDDLYSIEEDIIKVSIYEESGISTGHGPYYIERWQDKVKCTISGHSWLDFTANDVNKGNAILTLCKNLNISIEETMAFGDNYNDLEMLSTVQYGYAMNNAVDDIKNRYKYHANTVEETIEELLQNGDL